MNEPIVKRIKDIEKLCKAEGFILENGRAITGEDETILKLLDSIMYDYTYGWYICEEPIFEQLKSINQFKIYILNLTELKKGV